MKSYLMLLLCVFSLGLGGCAQLTRSPNVEYQFVQTELDADVLPPPKISHYQLASNGSYYKDPRTPYIEDLHYYVDYLGQHLDRLEERSLFVSEPRKARCGMFILPQEIKMPKLAITNLNDVEQTLEETLIYAQALREYNKLYEQSVEKAYKQFLKTCKV